MRILFATTRAAGHFRPLVPVAHACARAGHDVIVAGPGSAAPLAERARLPFRALPEPGPAEVARVRAWVRSDGPQASIERATTDLYARAYGAAALPGMLAAIEAWRPDLVVRESAEFSSCVVAEHLGVAAARVGIALSATLEDWGLRTAAAAIDELRATLGSEPDPGAERARAVPCFTQAPRALEPSAAPEPAWIRRFRVPPDGAAQDLPDWWGGSADPLVYVSFGTEAASSTRTHFPGLYRSVVEALAEMPVRVLVTIGDERDPDELGPLPASVRVERWVAQAAVMPHAAAMVGHGGAGSTLMALAAGVPMALVPLFADQAINARRVAELGAGVVLDEEEMDTGRVAAAVRELLDAPGHAAGAARVAAEVAALPTVDAVVETLVAPAGATGATRT